MRSVRDQLAYGKRLGRHETRHDIRTLRLRNYLPAKLPSPPKTLDHASKVSDWGMDLNDQLGDCVMAAIAHHILGWTTYAGSPRQPTEQQIKDLYLQLSPGDQGLEVLTTLNYWRQTGCWGDKIDAFVALDPGDIYQAQLGVQYFGQVQIGLALPDINTFGPFEDAVGSGPPDQQNGHDVILVGWDTSGFNVVSWGEVMHMSWAWYQKYAGPPGNGEAYAILSRDWLDAKGLDPDGFDYNTLAADLQQLTGTPAPPPPPPGPQPNPGPGCFGALAGLVASVSGMPT